MENWSYHRDLFFNRLPSWGPGPDVLLSSLSGSLVISHAKFDAFEGEGDALPYAVLGMCMAGGGRTCRESDFGQLSDVWHPGKVGLVLPGSAASGYTPAMKMIMVAFNLEAVSAYHGKKITIDELRMASNQLFEDELAASVLLAMLHDAEAHGVASDFFAQGLSLVLHRLITRTESLSCDSYSTKIKHQQMIQVIEMIENRLDEELRVKELASSLGLGTRTFTRMFKRDTGYTPFQYLTVRRMERAKTLLTSTHSVTDVALAVGYANPAKFTAAFRRCFGTTPSEWKNNAALRFRS